MTVHRPWRTWSEVPARPPQWACGRKRFVLEIFVGLAGLSIACSLAGLWVLPPVDFESSEAIGEAVDVFDPTFQSKLTAWVVEGAIGLVHFGTPCSSFSTARRDDGGPPPLRSWAEPYGRASLALRDRRIARDGNRLAAFTVRWARLVFAHEAAFTIENPADSWLWQLPSMQRLAHQCGVAVVSLAMCAFGAKAWKRTVVWTTAGLFGILGRGCPGEGPGHRHVRLSCITRMLA